ncbi:MAG: hypothetical protein WDZ47_01020 [Bacteroidales bacterium]
MARNCNVCEHKERVSIEKQIVKGYSKNKIASEFNVPEYSLRYHEENHLSRQLKTAYEIKTRENGLDVFSELENMIVGIKNIVDKAEKKGHDGKFLAATRELRSSLELLSKIKFAMAQQNDGEGFLTDGERRSKRAQEEYSERLSADIEKNLDNLSEEEKSVYHAIIIKLINGHKNRIKYIHYNDSGNIPVHDFKDTTEYKPNVDDDDEPTQPMKRTKGVKQDEDEDDPTTWGPVQPVEIPYTPWKDNPLNRLRRR